MKGAVAVAARFYFNPFDSFTVKILKTNTVIVGNICHITCFFIAVPPVLGNSRQVYIMQRPAPFQRMPHIINTKQVTRDICREFTLAIKRPAVRPA